MASPSLCRFPSVYKLDLIGDCFMAASGLNLSNNRQEPPARPAESAAASSSRPGGTGGKTPAELAKMETATENAAAMLVFAEAILEASSHCRFPHNGEPVRLRIGVHTGRVTSGVLGQVRRKFTIIGRTVRGLPSGGREGLHAADLIQDHARHVYCFTHSTHTARVNLFCLKNSMVLPVLR